MNIPRFVKSSRHPNRQEIRVSLHVAQPVVMPSVEMKTKSFSRRLDRESALMLQSCEMFRFHNFDYEHYKSLNANCDAGPSGVDTQHVPWVLDVHQFTYKVKRFGTLLLNRLNIEKVVASIATVNNMSTAYVWHMLIAMAVHYGTSPGPASRVRIPHRVLPPGTYAYNYWFIHFSHLLGHFQLVWPNVTLRDLMIYNVVDISEWIGSNSISNRAFQHIGSFNGNYQLSGYRRLAFDLSYLMLGLTADEQLYANYQRCPNYFGDRIIHVVYKSGEGPQMVKKNTKKRRDRKKLLDAELLSITEASDSSDLDSDLVRDLDDSELLFQRSQQESPYYFDQEDYADRDRYYEDYTDSDGEQQTMMYFADELD